MVLPTTTFTIPSIQDGVDLECRIYHPPPSSAGTSQASSTTRRRGAIIAHPYAHLGGCFDDPAVIAATSALVKEGYIVGTFNFRGAGGSKGSTSWTGRAEVADYVSFIGFFVHYMQALRDSVLISPVAPGRRQSNKRTDVQPSRRRSQSGHRQESMSLILGGYSYGSRIVTHLPSLQSILKLFSNVKSGSTEAAILQEAASLSAQRNAELLDQELNGTEYATPEASPRRSHHAVRLGGHDDDSIPVPDHASPGRRSHPRLEAVRQSIEHARGRRKHRKSHDGLPDDGPGSPTTTHESGPSISPKPCAPIDLAFLIISPVLPPIGWLIGIRLHRPAATRMDWDTSALEVAGKSMSITDEFWDYPTLVVHGSEDQYSSGKRVANWIGGLQEKSNQTSSMEIPGTGHFWHSPQAQEALKSAIRDWARKKT